MIKRLGSSAGFTLVEIAIVLVVIGLLLSGGLLAVSPVLQSSRVSQTEQHLDRIEQALILHAIRYGCLPCPADPTLASGAADAGSAQTGVAAFYDNGCTASACQQTSYGAVPWVNLELSEADVLDGFGYRIDYSLTATLQNTNGLVHAPPSSYPAGTLAVLSAAAGTAITSQAAYVLVSHGADHSLGYSTSSIQATDPNGSADQAENADADTTFVQADENSTSGATHFDDIVRWRTAPLIIQLCGTNACGNPS
jgi:prepilin-type N-terminal cleavage/methylation domain-containing protein